MRSSLAIAIVVAALAGCSVVPPNAMPPGPLLPVVYDNPSLVPINDWQSVWETVADVVDDYFHIEREEPVRLIGTTLTEGRIDTFPQVSPTVFEPWRQDVATDDQRVENTLQSLRRKAMVRVIPAQGGFWIEVTVMKELEDTLPEHATPGVATFQYDHTLTRVINPLVGPEVGQQWIPQGRDTALEQRILAHLHTRFGNFAPRALPVQQPGPPLVPAVLPQNFGPAGSPAPGVPHCMSPASSGSPLVTGVSSAVQRTCCYAPDVTPLNAPGTTWIDPPPAAAPSEASTPWSGQITCSFPFAEQFLQDAWLDYQQFYSCRGLTCLGLGLGTAAILANTPLDENFQQWYHDNARSSSGDNFASFVREFGNGWYAIPVFAGAALLGPYCVCPATGAVVGEWGDRCLRTVVVAGPPVLFFQVALGNTRPFVEDAHSRWTPFEDNHGVSGHAFIGAIGFINAAKMSDDVGFKLTMYALSTLTAWSRVNDDRHFLSQALLGWWFAYLGATAVDCTERGKREFAIVPLAMDDGVGVAAMWQW